MQTCREKVVEEQLRMIGSVFSSLLTACLEPAKVAQKAGPEAELLVV